MPNVTITGTFLDSLGTGPATGRGYIEPSVPVLQNGTVLIGGIPFELDETGSFSVTVLATDDPTLSPLNFTYRLGIRLTDHTPRRLPDVYFLAPGTAGTLDVSDLIDVGPPVPPSAALVPTQYTELDARLDVLEAEGSMVTFSLPGSLSATTGTARLYNDSGSTRTLTSVRASVGTAPAGGSVVVDVLKNGTSLYPTTTRPTIADGTNTGAAVPDTTTWAAGEYLTVDVVGVGGSTPGADLTVTAAYR